jgi:hypothetical protein
VVIAMWERIHPLLSTTAVALSGAGTFLILLDWILPKEAKKWIEDKASTAWLWLSYHRTWPLIRKLEAKRAFYTFLILGLVIGQIMLLGLLMWQLDMLYDWLVSPKQRLGYSWTIALCLIALIAILLFQIQVL